MRLGTLFGKHRFRFGALEILKFIGPGFLVTVGFIDPGNWAANVAAGSTFGFRLLWIVTLGTLMLIILQHNAAHLGIATGLCLAEAVHRFFPKYLGGLALATAVAAAISTALAEILGAAIGLNMLFGLPLKLGAALTAGGSGFMVLSNSYRRIERWILIFVSLIAISFIFELSLVRVPWSEALHGWIVPSIPAGSILVVMSVLGAVVMPHNIFLHSEVIQSRQWNLQSESVIHRQLKYEFVDTLLAMISGWAINSAMVIVAAAVFFANGLPVSELPSAEATLRPLLGNAAATIFALALLLAGLASSVTAAMAGGSIVAGMFGEPFHVADNHSRLGIVLTLGGAFLVLLGVGNPFRGLIWSQVVLSMQLPLTIIPLLWLTSSKRVMGRFVNSLADIVLLGTVAAVVVLLNILLLRGIL